MSVKESGRTIQPENGMQSPDRTRAPLPSQSEADYFNRAARKARRSRERKIFLKGGVFGAVALAAAEAVVSHSGLMPHIGGVGLQNIKPHGTAQVHEETWNSKVVDYSCNSRDTVDVGVKVSTGVVASLGFFHQTITGAHIDKLVPVWWLDCGNGNNSANLSIGILDNKVKDVNLNVLSSNPVDVGENVLDPTTCLPLKSNATLADIQKARSKYLDDEAKHKLDACDWPLHSDGFFATDSQADQTDVLARQLAVIAASLTPLSASQYTTIMGHAEDNYRQHLSAEFPGANITINMAPEPSTLTQIESGWQAIAPEVGNLFSSITAANSDGQTIIKVDNTHISGEAVLSGVHLTEAELGELNAQFHEPVVLSPGALNW